MKTKLIDDMIRELCVICTTDEAGRHFTSWSQYYDPLECLGLVTVERPVHESTGIPYSLEYWSIDITRAGQKIVDKNQKLHPST